jgi:hypothetical protein
MDDAPAVKLWGKEDKEQPQKLINQGKVNILHTDSVTYINQVRHKYFRSRETYNFRHNFRTYARYQEIEDHPAGCR